MDSRVCGSFRQDQRVILLGTYFQFLLKILGVNLNFYKIWRPSYKIWKIKYKHSEKVTKQFQILHFLVSFKFS